MYFEHAPTWEHTFSAANNDKMYKRLILLNWKAA
jgi:hypothetical protein